MRFTIFPSQINIRVDFPALSELVGYLQGDQQKQIDALVAQVEQLTASLKQSNTGLSAAIQETK